jgi:hypothetical protein
MRAKNGEFAACDALGNAAPVFRVPARGALNHSGGKDRGVNGKMLRRRNRAHKPN